MKVADFQNFLNIYSTIEAFDKEIYNIHQKHPAIKYLFWEKLLPLYSFSINPNSISETQQ